MPWEEFTETELEELLESNEPILKEEEDDDTDSYEDFFLGRLVLGSYNWKAENPVIYIGPIEKIQDTSTSTHMMKVIGNSNAIYVSNRPNFSCWFTVSELRDFHEAFIECINKQI